LLKYAIELLTMMMIAMIIMMIMTMSKKNQPEVQFHYLADEQKIVCIMMRIIIEITWDKNFFLFLSVRSHSLTHVKVNGMARHWKKNNFKFNFCMLWNLLVLRACKNWINEFVGWEFYKTFAKVFTVIFRSVIAIAIKMEMKNLNLAWKWVFSLSFVPALF
jgi:hypothetical protein